MLLFVPVFAFFYLRANQFQMNVEEFKQKFISLYTNIKPHNQISYMYTLLFCIRRYIIGVMTIFLNSFVVFNIIVYFALQIGTISMYLHFKPMLTKFLNRIEIMNETLIFISVYFMMIFTNWI